MRCHTDSEQWPVCLYRPPVSSPCFVTLPLVCMCAGKCADEWLGLHVGVKVIVPCAAAAAATAATTAAAATATAAAAAAAAANGDIEG